MLPISRAELDETLFNALRAVFRFERMKVAQFELNFEAIYLLQYLRRQGAARMQQVAEEMSIPVSTATRVIDRMQKKGLVRREKGREDKRQLWVSLTGEGEAAVHRIDEHSARVIMRNIENQGFTPEEVEAFVKTAVHLRQLLDVSDTSE